MFVNSKTKIQDNVLSIQFNVIVVIKISWGIYDNVHELHTNVDGLFSHFVWLAMYHLLIQTKANTAQYLVLIFRLTTAYVSCNVAMKSAP